MGELIFKYQLQSGVSTIETHRGATPLSVGTQDGKIWVWVKLDQSRPREKLRFAAVFTGLPIDHALAGVSNVGELMFIGSTHDQGLVWHIFKIEDAV